MLRWACERIVAPGPDILNRGHNPLQLDDLGHELAGVVGQE